MDTNTRPSSVVTAVRIMWISLVAGLLGLALWIHAQKLPIPIGFLMLRPLLSSIPIAVLTYAIWTGKNWARLIFVIFTAYGTLLAGLDIVLEFHRLPGLMLFAAALGLADLFCIYLLFTSPSNTWFKAMHQPFTIFGRPIRRLFGASTGGKP